MNRQKVPEELYFLWHPHTVDTFSGYGLPVQPGQKDRLIGLLMVDRPRLADAVWLAGVEALFGEYQLFVMTTKQERGIACQMWVERDSQPYLRDINVPFTDRIKLVLMPLFRQPPKPRLTVRWDEELKLWTSEFRE